MSKMIVLDMDGTITDLYGVDGWLDDLNRKSARPYIIAKPLYDMETLNIILDLLRSKGWKIVVTSWLSKEYDRDFANRIRSAKINWIKKNGLKIDEIHIVKYGTPKSTVTRKEGGFQILVDDEEPNRKEWTLGATIDGNKNIINELLKIFEREVIEE